MQQAVIAHCEKQFDRFAILDAGLNLKADGSMGSALMTQRAWSSPQPPDVCEDFWTSVYQAIDD